MVQDRDKFTNLSEHIERELSNKIINEDILLNKFAEKDQKIQL